ncbi:NERD domain-containing protein [Haloferax elongans]|uniref:NERD domain-containing protein n=1 Tax=Haloferax elongans TaxID=403191 RepID=UPI0006779378|nr:nuclease-related domain-containing DEAD/DEAH box helicase [Haloferax elongans]
MEYKPASSVSPTDPGGQAELDVWGRLKEAFDSSDRGVIYHQYPIIDKTGRKFDKKPDFVIFHQELGLVILECKGYTIDQIDRITGETWHLRGMSQSRSTPLEQARRQGFALRKFFMDEPELLDGGQVAIPMNPFVVLPNITREEWEARGFTGPSAPRVLLGDELTPVALREQLDAIRTFEPLTPVEYDTARAVLSCGQAISDVSMSPPENPETRRDYYEHVTSQLAKFDLKQEKIGMRIPPGPQQIRGIAGSGKTVLLAMKAAKMAVDHKDWTIALTFQTKSLYDHITDLTERFYRRFSNGQSLAESDAAIEIIHGWGGHTTGPGVYKRIAEATPNATFRSVTDARAEFDRGTDLQEAVAAELLETGDIPDLFDAILVDEAQDFGPYFFNMCLAALGSSNRLIWGYDEAQNLHSLRAPSPKEIFGVDDDGDPVVDLSGSYSNGVQKSHIMRKSYRAPREILLTAHVLGMGLLRDGGPVQAITRQDGWENLGYDVDGDFRKTGSHARLQRPEANSPHPLTTFDTAGPFVSSEAFDDPAAELDWVVEQVVADVREEDLPPERVLVIPLGLDATDRGEQLQSLLRAHDLGATCTWEGDKTEFSRPGEVTISTIHRAKGNEAASVYVVGLNNAITNPYRGPVQARNEVFVALTRSRAWCTITGCTHNDEVGIMDELHTIIDIVSSETPVVEFEVPSRSSLNHELEEDTENLTATNLTDFA